MPNRAAASAAVPPSVNGVCRTALAAALIACASLAGVADAQTIRTTNNTRTSVVTTAPNTGASARLWFDERSDEAFARALPLGFGASGGFAVVPGAGEGGVGVYSAIRPRLDGVVLNPQPAGRRGPIRFRGSGIGSVQAGGAGLQFNTDSPTRFGASRDDLDTIIFVRTRDALPPIAISPWQDVTDENIDALVRANPFLVSSNRADLLEDLREGRRQWLRENGYLSPRTYTGTRRGVAAQRREAEMRDVRDIVQARHGETPEPEADRPARERRTELGEDSYIRMSNTGPAADTRDAAEAADGDEHAAATEPDAPAIDESDAGERLGSDSFIRIRESRRPVQRPQRSA